MSEKSQSSDLIPKGENYNFVQLNRGHMQALRALTRKSPLAHEILYYLVEHMGKTTNAVIVSYKTLQEVTNVSRSTVARAISILKDDNWVDAVKVGSATAYAVNARVFWQASRNQKEYAIFSATVVAAASEQDEGFRDKAKHKLRHVPVIQSNERAQISNAERLTPPDQTDLDLD